MEQDHYSCIYGNTNILFAGFIQKDINGKEVKFSTYLPKCTRTNKMCVLVKLCDPDDLLSIEDSNIRCEYYKSNKTKQVKTHTVVIPADPTQFPDISLNSTNSYIKSNLHNMIKPNRN